MVQIQILMENTYYLFSFWPLIKVKIFSLRNIQNCFINMNFLLQMQKDQEKIAEMLLENGVNTNVTDKGGKKVILNAARRGSFIFVLHLLFFVINHLQIILRLL